MGIQSELLEGSFKNLRLLSNPDFLLGGEAVGRLVQQVRRWQAPVFDLPRIGLGPRALEWTADVDFRFGDHLGRFMPSGSRVNGGLISFIDRGGIGPLGRRLGVRFDPVVLPEQVSLGIVVRFLPLRGTVRVDLQFGAFHFDDGFALISQRRVGRRHRLRDGGGSDPGNRDRPPGGRPDALQERRYLQDPPFGGKDQPDEQA